MRILKTIIFFTLLFLISCNKEKGNSFTKARNFPIVIDTFNLKSKQRNSDWLESLEYNFLYIGNKIDTIYPNYRLKYFPLLRLPPPPQLSGKYEEYKINVDSINRKSLMYPFYLNYFNHKPYKYCTEVNLKITVDTTQIINKEDIYLDNNNYNYKAYPLLIESNLNDTIIIGFEDIIPIELEAKDANGNWKLIEEQYRHFCGTGLGRVILPPKNIVLTSTMIYDGDFNTKIRIKLGNSYSNEYSAKINYNQFESKYTSDGKLKKKK